MALTLSEQDRHALALWPLGTILSAVAPEWGTVNRTLIVHSENGAHVLRVSRRERERVAWEHTVIHSAAERGVPVLLPVPLPDGSTVLEVGDLRYALFPLAPGRQIARAALRVEHATAAGECLARLHLALQGLASGRARRKILSGDTQGALTVIPRIEAAIRPLPCPTETERAALEQLAGRRAWLEQTGYLAEGLEARLVTLPQTVLHGDFQETNLFFEGGEVSAVIDWDQSGLAARGWEVVRALDLMLGLAPASCRAFLASYREALPLPEDELQEAASCYGVLTDRNLWVYEAVYLEGNGRARQFIGEGKFTPFPQRWASAGLTE